MLNIDRMLEQMLSVLKKKNLAFVSQKPSNHLLLDKVETRLINDNSIKVYRFIGARMTDRQTFFQEVARSLRPLIQMGDNMDAFRDAISTCGLYGNDQWRHVIIWDNAHVLLMANPTLFYQAVDYLLGTIKELRQGDEKGMLENPEEFEDWSSVDIQCVIGGNKELIEARERLLLLSDPFWKQMFYSLDTQTVFMDLSH